MKITAETLMEWMLEDGGNILHDRHHPKVFTGYVTFTKERADAALQCNVKNRKINDDSIKVLAEALESGLWDENVSKINFDENMTLSDGQHRLEVVSRTGKMARILVTYGVSESAQGVTDRRGKRTLSDDISIIGKNNTFKRAAVARMHYCFSNGMTVSQYVRGAANKMFVSDATLFKYYLDHEQAIDDILDRILRVSQMLSGLKINGTVLNALVFKFDEIDQNDSQQFWASLGRGVFRVDDDPVMRLRTRLAKNALSETTKIPNHVVAALIIKAWNMFEVGEVCKNLSYRSGGATPEEFPEIVNPYKDMLE